MVTVKTCFGATKKKEEKLHIEYNLYVSMSLYEKLNLNLSVMYFPMPICIPNYVGKYINEIMVGYHYLPINIVKYTRIYTLSPILCMTFYL